jgi:hypothetical protein
MWFFCIGPGGGGGKLDVVTGGVTTADLKRLADEFDTKLRLGAEKHGVTTEAQWVTDLRDKSQLVSNHDLDQYLEEVRTRGWIADSCPEFPVFSTGESPRNDWATGTQAFVARMLTSIISSSSYVYPVSSRNDNKFVKTGKFKLMLLSVPDPESFKKRSFGTRLPDVVCYEGRERRGSQAITMIGDVKSYTSHGDFPEAEIGHVLDMAKKLLMDHQVFRTYLYCFLTDGHRFQFFKVTRNTDSLLFEQSSVLTGIRGWQVR